MPVQPLNGDVTGEIKAKVDFWRQRLLGQLERFNTHADMWRLVKPARSGDLSGFSNPQLTETTRATEAIATFMYRALTSADPNFQMLSHNPNTSQEMLWQSESVISWQKRSTQYNRKLLRALRSCSLFGTVGVEEPWVECPGQYQGTDFVPRSLLQMAFDPLSMDISASPWHATIDFVTEEALLKKAADNPDVFDPMMVQTAIESMAVKDSLPPEVLARLAAAGYLSFSASGTGTKQSRILYLTTYYGPLSDNPTPNGGDWCVGVLNDNYVVRAHESSYSSRPFEFAHLNEFEMEPYGYGTGRVGEAMQPEMNSNRGRMHDTITYSLLNMWVANRMANIKTSQLKIKPWGLVEIDGDTDGLKPIRPQLEGVNFGIMLEKMMKEEYRTTTGASDNLQALVTEASATEASIAQSEAVRRLSVISEIVAESLVRRHIEKMHQNNLDLLGEPFWIANTGIGKPPTRIYPGNLAQNVEVIVKVVTDKDFRPQRNKDILQLVQLLTSIRSDHPEIGTLSIKPWIEELARGVGMNPAAVLQQMPMMPSPMGLPAGGPPPTAMDRIGQSLGNAETVRGTAGELGQAARAYGQSQLPAGAVA